MEILVMKRALIFLSLLFALDALHAQQRSENLIIITLDGFRWQEVFRGADSSILFNRKFTKDQSAIAEFWNADLKQRRSKLMPFFWSTISQNGQLYGNRDFKNAVACANPYLISYPGYSEILVGYIDEGVRSNRKIENKNSNVLEFIGKQKKSDDGVAVFSTWSAMPFIVRSKHTPFHINSGREKVTADSLTQKEILLNELQDHILNPYGERFDAFTFYYAFEYLKRKSPHTLMINFDETDEHGHGGRYDQYLFAAQRIDEMIGELWKWIQTDEKYKDKTTLIITTDHGRGKGAKGGWKRHGKFTPGSKQTWIAVMGPDTPPLGEMQLPGKYYQKQIAKTAAALLGFEYANVQPVGNVIQEALSFKRNQQQMHVLE